VLGNVLAAICAVTWSFTVMGYRWLAHAARPSRGAVSGICGRDDRARDGAATGRGRPVDWAVVAFLGVFQLGIPYLFLAARAPCSGARGRPLPSHRAVLNPIWAWLFMADAGPGTLAGGALILGATAGRMLLMFDKRQENP